MPVPHFDAEWRMPDRHVGRRVLVFDEVTSTNDVAAQLIGDPQNDGTVIVASVQTRGRGQYGNVWQCPPGSGVLLSVLLNPPTELNRPAILTAWAAVAVAETILGVTGAQARIKWPNDLLIQGKKVCGILIEQSRSVVAGIGLNVNQFAENLLANDLPNATSLSIIAGRPFDYRMIARELIVHLDAGYKMMRNGELPMLESLWKWRVGLLGRQVTVTTQDGRNIEGRLKEMGFDGFAIETEEGLVLERPENVKSLKGKSEV